MSDKEKFHEYDGIIEHDNPLPTWWLWTFLLSIVFGALYYLHYQFGGGPTLNDELAVAMAQLDKEKSSVVAASPLETEDSLRNEFSKEGLLGKGEAAFGAKCSACHGQQLQGMIGPNLTDHFWLHGKATRMDLVKVIREGVPDKGMPPWDSVMSKDELYAVASFIISKKDSNPANPKAPQGEEVP